MRTRVLLALIVIAGAVAGGWPLDGARAGGASFTVDSVADAVDAAPGDGVCATAVGACTLRAAVQESNALAGPDAIALPAGVYELTAAGADEDSGATGDLDVRDDLTIAGAGPSLTIIDGTAQDRVLDVDPGAGGIDVELSGLTVRNGDALEGGGLLNSAELALRDIAISGNHGAAGGGIANRGGAVLSLSRVTITGNSAGTAGAIQNVGSVIAAESSLSGNTTSDDGGAVVNLGTFTATASRFDDNESGDNGGAFWGSGRLEISGSSLSGNTAMDEGGAIVNFGGGAVTLMDSVVSGNQAVNLRGGGLVNFIGSTMTVVETTVSDNMAGTLGGGVLNNGTLTLERSTVSGNVAGGAGGGLQAGGTTTMTNVTISGNTAGGGGGGIVNDGTLAVASVTIAANTSGAPGGGIAGGGAAVAANAILAENAPDNCAGAVASLGNNLDDGTSCGFGQATDLTDVDAQLEPLAGNGGRTRTHALAAQSPAVDAGGDAACPAVDQRGVARPQGTGCDIGAFELGGAPAVAGDANCDGVANSLDAAIVLQYAAGLVDSLPCLALADVNGDGRVDAIDAALILQYDAGLLDMLSI